MILLNFASEKVRTVINTDVKEKKYISIDKAVKKSDFLFLSITSHS